MKKSKRILSLLLVCILMLVFGCGKENADPESIILINEAAEESVEVKTESTENIIVSDENGIEFETLPDDIKGLIIPMDSLLLYYAETNSEYNPEDAGMFWRVMNYAIGNFGEFYNRAELVGSELAVDSMVIGEFASAFIVDFEGIPVIPDALSARVRFDSEEDIYYFGVGDRGISQTEILSYEYVDNNTLKISARLFAIDDDSTIKKADFIFVRNEYAAGVIEPLFYFTVTEATFIEE